MFLPEDAQIWFNVQVETLKRVHSSWVPDVPIELLTQARKLPLGRRWLAKRLGTVSPVLFGLPADLVHVAAQGLAFGDQAPGTLSDDKRTARAHDPTRMVTGIQPWLDADETATLCSRGARCVPGSPGDGPLVHYVVTVANSGNAGCA